MMSEFLKFLEQSKYVKREKALNIKDVITAQKDLVRVGFPFLPTDFLEFLRHYNGVKASDSAILGIPPLENPELDIKAFNQEFNAAPDKVILGYDDFVFLIYDHEDKVYQLVDKSGALVLEEFAEDELGYALNSVLHVDEE